MKESIVKTTFAVVAAALTVYFQVLAVPVVILILVMSGDYLTGMLKAWVSKEINSRCGIIGIIKKLCYLLVVCCGIGADWLIGATLAQVGISYNEVFTFGVLACIWLIINELISILENLAVIGVPLPGFLTAIISKLKITVEQKAQELADANKIIVENNKSTEGEQQYD